MLLGYRRYDKSGMKIHKRLAKRCELRVSPPYLDLTSHNGVSDVASSSFTILASVCDLDLKLGVFVEDLLDSAIVAAFLGLDLGGGCGSFIVESFVAEVRGARYEVGLVGGGVAGWRSRGAIEAWWPQLAMSLNCGF